MKSSKMVYYPFGKTVLTTDRFVFYNSLFKDDPILAKTAQGKLYNSFANELTLDEKQQNSFSEILSFLKKTISFEQKREKDFFQKKLLSNPIFNKYPLFKKKIRTNLTSSNFDYINFIAALNVALKGIDLFEKNLNHELSRLKKLKENYNKLYKTEGEKYIQNLYIRDMDKLKKEYNSQIMKEVSTTLAGIQSDIFNDVISEIINSPKYKTKIIQLIESSGYATFSCSQESINFQIRDLLSEPIAHEIAVNFSSRTSILSNLESIYEKFYKEAIASVNFSSKIKTDSNLKNLTKYNVIRNAIAEKTLSEEENQYLKDLAKILVGDSKNSKKTPIEELQDIIDSIDSAISTKQGQIFTILGKSYISLGNDKVQEISSRSNKSIGKVKNIFSVLSGYKGLITKKINSNVQAENIYNIIKSNIELITFEISRPDMAEYNGAVSTYIKLKGLIDGSANLKNDFILTVDPSNLINSSKIDKEITSYLLENLIYDVTQIEKELRIERHIGKRTNLSVSDEAFKLALERFILKIEKELQEANLSSQEIKNEINFILKNCFIIQGSVKDYENYNNEIGFIGGSLGSGGKIEALENLYQMYELGGITPVDKDWLYFAIMNSSSASLGSNLKNPIEKYLSFAAAMIMFNYGSTEIQQASEYYINQITPQNSVNFINLYYVNGFYFPSSFILTLILENITECFSIIQENANKKTTGVKIYNKSNPSWINSYNETYSEEWYNIKEKTHDNLLIKFTFLAGLLDILESLQNYMKPFNK